ncbi:MAG: hypothetical protein K6T94_24965 [Paenibacillus sp.]|nr:hypothetical protein [Paenibacillus sp.]
MEQSIGNQEFRKRSKKSSNVPGQNLGYSLQHTRFLSRLLSGTSGEKITLEVFEDVGVEDTDGNRTYEQGKSVGVRGNPLADRSVDFWKTISNWVDSASNEDLTSNHKYEIYVSKPLKGNICKIFEEANTLEDAQKAIIVAKALLWGEEPDYNLKDSVSESIDQYLNNVFNCNNRTIGNIIKNFKVIVGSGSPQNDLREQMKRALIPELFLEEAINWALGLVKRQTDLLLEQQKAAVVEYDWFHSEMTSFNLTLNNGLKLRSDQLIISEPLIEHHLRNSIYVKQLLLIDCDNDEQLTAVNDFLRAANDRTYWGERGLVNKTSFNEYEAQLKRTLASHKKIINIEHPQLDNVLKGTLLFHKSSNHILKLQGMEVPEHFTPGSYHTLSNKRVLGWHPNYEDLL